MGRTIPTYRQILENIVDNWHHFRLALRKNERKIFDQLIEKARKHAGAASYETRMDPMDSFFFSILLEQEKDIEKLKKREVKK
jgi:hypothetical protein